MKERIGDIWRRYRARCCGIGSALLIVWTVIGGWGAAAEEELSHYGSPLTNEAEELTSGSYYLDNSVTPKYQMSVWKGEDVTIHLQGKRLNLGNHYIVVEGTLTICDCGKKKSEVVKQSGAYPLIRVQDGGKLIVNGGEWEHAKNSAIIVNGSGEVIINKGTLHSIRREASDEPSACTIVLNDAESTCTINDGKIYSDGNSPIYAKGKVTINGGTIEANKNKQASSKFSTNKVSVNVRSGSAVVELLKDGQLILSGTPTFKKGDDSPTIRVAQLSDSAENAPLALSLNGTPYTGYPLQVEVEKWEDEQYLAKDVPKECEDKLQSTPTIYYNDKDNTFGSKDPSIHGSHSPGGGLQPIDYQKWPEEEGWPEGNALNGGNYYLTDNVDLSDSIKITGAVNICLNGHTISSTDEPCFIIESDGSLTVCDHGGGAIVSKASPAITDKSIFAAIENHGTLTLYSGAVCGDWIGVRDYKT